MTRLPDVLPLPEVGRLLADYQTGNPKRSKRAAELLVAHNMRIVVREVGKVSSAYSSTEDLTAAAQYGLLMAAKRVDPERPYGFYKIAVMEVRNALRHETRRAQRGVVLSDRAARHAAKMAKARREGHDTPERMVQYAVDRGSPRGSAEALLPWVTAGKVVPMDTLLTEPETVGRIPDTDMAASIAGLPARLQPAALDNTHPHHREALARLAHPTRLFRAH